MAKRARGSTSRPGQRRPIQRPAARPGSQGVQQGPTVAPRSDVADTRPASLTAEEEARAAELEAVIVAQERQAEANQRRSQRGAPEVPARASTTLATAAANEYAYVARDVRRVAIVGGTLVSLLVALWVVVQVTGVSV
jgi:hypothetical protein